MPPQDYLVTVCAACLTASCWHGDFYCQKHKTASTRLMRASELQALDRENPDHYSWDAIVRNTGSIPKVV